MIDGLTDAVDGLRRDREEEMCGGLEFPKKITKNNILTSGKYISEEYIGKKVMI